MSVLELPTQDLQSLTEEEQANQMNLMQKVLQIVSKKILSMAQISEAFEQTYGKKITLIDLTTALTSLRAQEYIITSASESFGRNQRRHCEYTATNKGVAALARMQEAQLTPQNLEPASAT